MMRLPITLCFAVLTGCALCLQVSRADDAKPPQGADEAKRLKGRWSVIALESDGKKAPAADLKDMRWSFTESEVQFTDPGEGAGGKSCVKFDPSKSPKHIDLVGLEGPQKGRTIQGIYKLEKDRLVVCLRDAEAAKKGRPKDFSTEADSGLGMITLELVKE